MFNEGKYIINELQGDKIIYMINNRTRNED